MPSEEILIKPQYIEDKIYIDIYCGDPDCAWSVGIPLQKQGNGWVIADKWESSLRSADWVVIDGVPYCDEHKPIGKRANNE